MVKKAHLLPFILLILFSHTASTLAYSHDVQMVEIASLPHSRVNAVSWSPDGTYLATMSWDEINFWNTSDWTLVSSIREPHVNSLIWSPNSQYVAGSRGGDSEQIPIWEAETGEFIVEFSRQRPSDSEGIATAPGSLAWHPEGHIIATEATLGLDGEILLWNADFSDVIQEPQRLNVADEVRHNVEGLLWSQSGHMLLISGSDDLEPVTGEPLHFTKTMSYVLDVAENNILLAVPERMMGWGANDTRVITSISSESNHRLTIWELSSGNALVNFDKHTSGITAVAWNAFMPVIASADVEGKLYFWNPDTGASYTTADMKAPIQDLAWKANSDMLALAVEDKVLIRTYDFTTR